MRSRAAAWSASVLPVCLPLGVQLFAQVGNLRGRNLRGAVFAGANLRGADLRGAFLQRADLERFANRVILVRTWTTNAYSKDLRVRVCSMLWIGVSREEGRSQTSSGSPSRPSNATSSVAGRARTFSPDAPQDESGASSLPQSTSVPCGSSPKRTARPP
jgi:Pentapeptide repeats (8 copies)